MIDPSRRSGDGADGADRGCSPRRDRAAPAAFADAPDSCAIRSHQSSAARRTKIREIH